MFAAIQKSAKAKLWPHQADAIDFAIKRLNGPISPALIRMPTGTGKTGVIACITMLSNPGSSLVLTPWFHLRDQLIDDLQADFWKEAIGISAPTREVRSLLPSTASKTISKGTATVYVSTFATLNELRREWPADYKALADAVSLVIVDEGHYEPAVEWGKSVKTLNAPTLLMTATPYRNDLKLFRITDPKSSVHHFTHRAAVDNGIIRELVFDALPGPTDMLSLSAEFAKWWKSGVKAGMFSHATPRAIVCCKGHKEIEQTVTALRKQGLTAIGIHDQFTKSTNAWLRNKVPKKATEDATIWVHQNKLTEGLDDTRFCCLALFTPILNDRKLIQQIGRVLRLKKAQPKTPAVLVSPPEFGAEEQWRAYLSFEQNLKLLDPQHFRDVVEKLLAAQPPVEYFDGAFRRRFAPAQLATDPQVVISPSVLVRKQHPSFALKDYVQDCTDTLNLEDAVVLGPDIYAPCQQSATFALWVYASIGNARCLERTSLYEIGLETHCVVIADGYVLLADSRGVFPTDYLDDHTAPVLVETLSRYIDDTFKPTEVSLNSTIPYDTAVRGTRLHGHNLLGVPTALTDRIHICRAARGRSPTAGRRYVGLVNGRLRQEITERARKHHGLKSFIEWATSTAKLLTSATKHNPVFGRYMQTCTAPVPTVPRTLCLDLQAENVHVTTADATDCELREAAVNIREETVGSKTVYRAVLTFNTSAGTPLDCTLQIDYQDLKQRFWFSRADDSSLHIDDGQASSQSRTFVDFLNLNQDIVLLGMKDGEVVYQGKSFYKVDYVHAEQALLGLIEEVSGASPCTTEKGTRAEIKALKSSGGKKFLPQTIFRSIAEGELPLPFAPELLICVDLGTECADFIAAHFGERKLALIHAKAGKGASISASAWHDVVAQAMKNLAYLTPNAERPDRVASWRKDAKWNKTGVSVLQKAPVGCPEGINLWRKIRSEIIESANPELFVLLATSGAVSVAGLKNAISIPAKRTPETAQLLHLLDGLNGHARQLGVRVKVYDIPYKPG